MEICALFAKFASYWGVTGPVLEIFSVKNENKVLGHFIDFGHFDLPGMVYSGR